MIKNIIALLFCLISPICAVADDLKIQSTDAPRTEVAPRHSPAPNSSKTYQMPHKYNFDLPNPYLYDLQRRLKRAWFPPRGEENKRVAIKMSIAKDGSLMDSRLCTSSGSEAADQAAMNAVRNAAPFRHLPEGAPDLIEIQFTFDRDVFRATGFPTENKRPEGF